ncbi:MAG: nicotinate-nucleotide adenylyltransferase [bacterium]
MAARVGIFGGSFNPIHAGHLMQADEARGELSLDRVIFVPANAPPHKDAAGLLDGEERFRLVELAVAGDPGFEASRVDIDREPPSYTVDTIRIVRDSLSPGTELFFLMGADSLIDLPNWRAPEEIVRLARLVVFPRPGYEPAASPFASRAEIVFLAGPRVSISSEEIRARIRGGGPYRYWVPDAVWRRIEECAFYQSAPDRTRHI